MVRCMMLPDGSVSLVFDAQSLPALLLVPGAPFTGYAVTPDGVTLLDASKQASLLNSVSPEVYRSLGLS